MPEAKLPTSAKGWLVALISSMIGFFAGMASIALVARMLGG